jgi:hypothetical protein
MRDEYSDFYKALEFYYKQKQIYEKEKTVSKRKILEDETLSIRDKQRLYSQMKPKCVNCKRPVGTIFSGKYENKSKERILKAFCGDVTNPCNLRIVLNPGAVYLYPDLLKEQEESVDFLKTKIIINKNKLIFNYISEKNAIDLFDDLKKNINETTTNLAYFLEEYIKITDNSETKKELLKKQEELYINIQNIKDSIEKFDNTNDSEYTKNAVEIYVNKMKPLLDEIMKMKYNVSFVEYNNSDNMYYLMQQKNSISDIEFYLEEPKIIENISGTVIANKNAKTKKQPITKPPKNVTLKQKPNKIKTVLEVDTSSSETDKGVDSQKSIDFGSDDE